MAITTYSELQTAIDNWLARTDLSGRSPEFITMAEARMNRELETRSQEKRATSALVVGDPYVTLPTDVRRIRHVRLNTSPRTILDFYSPSAVDTEWAATGTGKPRMYSVVGEELYLRPAPDSTETLEIDYIASISALTDSNTSNTILSRHPDVYLHGALAEAFGYLMDAQRQAQHDALFTRAIGEIKMDEDRAKYGGSPLQLSAQYGELR